MIVDTFFVLFLPFQYVESDADEELLFNIPYVSFKGFNFRIEYFINAYLYCDVEINCTVHYQEVFVVFCFPIIIVK